MPPAAIVRIKASPAAPPKLRSFASDVQADASWLGAGAKTLKGAKTADKPDAVPVM